MRLFIEINRHVTSSDVDEIPQGRDAISKYNILQSSCMRFGFNP